MDSSRIIGIHQTRNQFGIQSINNDNINEAIGRLLYFQEDQKREGVAVLVSPQHIITPIVNIVSPQSKEFSAKDSFVFQSSFGEYIGVKELFFEKTFEYDDWNENSIADQQYCCCAIMLLERPISNIRYTGVISIIDYKDFFKVHINKNIYIPTGKNDSIQTIDNFEQDKLYLAFDLDPSNTNQDVKSYNLFKITTQVPVFVIDAENLGGFCLIGFAQQYNQTTKFQTWILNKENFEDIHKWLNGNNASFTVDYETTLDSCRNFKSKELKDSKSTQAHTGKILSLFKLEKFYAASCSEDKQIKVWNWRTGKLKKIFKTDRPCKSIFGVNEFLIGVEGAMMIVIDWKSKKVENISTHTNEINLVCPIKSKIDKIQRIILIDNQDGIYLYKFDMKSKGFQFEKELMKWDIPNDQINQCLVYSDQHIIFSTARSGHLTILNWITGKEERRFEINQTSVGNNEQQQNGIQCIMIHPQKNNYIFISFKNGQFIVWDADSGVIALTVSHFNPSIQIMCKQSYNQIVISDGKDYQLLIIQQFLSFFFKKCSNYHFSEINSLLYLDDEFFLSSDISGRLRIWQLESSCLLPDGTIGTLNNPVFNILQCPELNSLNNSFSSASGFNLQQQQNGQPFYSCQNYYNNINNNEYTQNIQANDKQRQLKHNIYHQTDYQYENERQIQEEFINGVNNINTSSNSQFSNQNAEQDQTFQNSKFVNDSSVQENNEGQQIINNQQDILHPFGQYQSHLLKKNEDDNHFFEHSPQFNVGSVDDIVNDKCRQQQIPPNVKMLNLEEIFNIKRKELEYQQQKLLQGSLLPISCLYSKQPQQLFQNKQNQDCFDSELQQINGRFTIPQNQLIQSERSFESEFSLSNHKKQVSKYNDDQTIQPQSKENDQIYLLQKEQGGDDQITQSLIENINERKENEQIQQNIEQQDKETNNIHNYNSTVSNASEQYLTQIHSHLNYQQDEICDLQQNVQEQQNNSINISNKINNPTQLSNMINEVNQKLIQMNQETLLQSQFKCQETQQQNVQTIQKSISMISQEEANQLRIELENLRIKINDYKKLNDSLDVNYQIITNKFNLELEKSEKEKKEKIEMEYELQNLREQIELKDKQKSKLNDDIQEIEKIHTFEVQQREKLLIDLQEIKNQYEQQNKINKLLSVDMQNQLTSFEQMISSDVLIKEQFQKDNDTLNNLNEDLINQIKIFKNEILNLNNNQYNISQENKQILQNNQDLSNEIQNLTKEKQNLINQNKDITQNNENLTNELSFIRKEKLNLNSELEKHQSKSSDFNKQLKESQFSNIQLEQKLSLLQSEFQSYKRQMESNKQQQIKERDELIFNIDQIILESATEKHLFDFLDSIKRIGSAKDFEIIFKNIYEKQIKNLQSQIEEQKKEKIQTQNQYNTFEAKNKSLISSIDKLNQENDKIKQESLITQNSLEHQNQQYKILLDHVNQQQKNIEQKDELILLLKQEIEKLNSLYLQQLQEQFNQNTLHSKNIDIEQCRKDLLLDEWASLLSLIDNESISQISRIEQTNRKSENPIIPLIQNQNGEQNQPIFSQVKSISQQNKQQSQTQDIMNCLLINNDKNEVLTAKQEHPNQQTVLPSKNLQGIQNINENNIQQSMSQNSQPKVHKLLQNQMQQNNKQQLNSNQMNVSPNLLAQPKSEQFYLSQQQEIGKIKQIQQNDKNFASYSEYNSQQLNLKSYQVNVENNSDKNNLVSQSPHQTNIYPICHQQSFKPLTPTNNNINNSQTISYSPFTNNDQKIKNQNNIPDQENLIILQNKNNLDLSTKQNLQIKQVQPSSPFTKSQQNNKLPFYSSQTNNPNAQIKTQQDRNLQEIQNLNKISLQEPKIQTNTDFSKDLQQSDKEHRSKSPQSVQRSNQTLIHNHNINKINQQILLQSMNNNSNDTNHSNINNKSLNQINTINNQSENKLQKSERSISCLQNLRNIKKNISLANVSSQPISTQNVTSISPNSHNDKSSDFIKRQMELQQFIQYNDKNFLMNQNQRSLTPQPQKQLIGGFISQPPKIISGTFTPLKQITSLSCRNQPLQEKDINNLLQEKIFKNHVIDPQQNKQKSLSVSILPKSQINLSPNSRVPSPHISSGNQFSYLQPTLNESSKQMSFSPTSYVEKRQKIKEALQMTYLNKDDLNSKSSNFIKQNLDYNFSQIRCKTEESNGLSIHDLQTEQYISSRNYQQNISPNNFYQNRLSPIANRREQQSSSPSNLQKLTQSMNNPPNQLNSKYDSNSVLNKIVSTTNQTRSYDFNQIQKNQFKDIHKTPISISPCMSSLQNNNNVIQQQPYLNNKINLNSISANNIIQSKVSKLNDQEHQLNIEYASQNGNIYQQHQFTLSPTAQKKFFSQKKSNTDIERFGNKIDINQVNQTQNNYLKDYHNNNLNGSTNSKTNFQHINEDQNQFQNVNINNRVKKPLFRNYSINSSQNQKNI